VTRILASLLGNQKEILQASMIRAYLVGERKVFGCHIGCFVGYRKGYSDTNKKINYITYLETAR